MKLRTIMLCVIALPTVLTIAPGRAQTFKVRVLDALNGKPYNDMPINFYCVREGQRKIAIKHTATDTNGFAELLYECRKDERIYLLLGALDGKSVWTGHVEECGSLEPQAIDRILNVGVISKPTAAGGIWCPAKVSKKLKPIPGEVIIFAKKLTWWQKYVAP